MTSNAMIGHMWANRSKDKAKTGNGNMSFVGDTVYSYSTPIGRLVTAEDNTTEIALVTCRTYSKTTSGKHMPAVHRAIKQTYFVVPELGWPNTQGASTVDHFTNMHYLVGRYNEAKKTYSRKRNVEYCPHELSVLANRAWQYAEIFAMEKPVLNPIEDANEIYAAHDAKEAKYNTPAAQAKRAKDKERRERAKEAKEAEAKAGRTYR